MSEPHELIRSHPVSILTYLYKFLYLLILPVARGFVSALTGGLLYWLSGAWFDVLVVLCIILLACLKWRNFKYYMDKTGIYFSYGLIFKQESFLPLNRISTISSLRSLWLRPFRIAKLRIDTIARDPQKADFRFYVSKREADRLLAFRRQRPIRHGRAVASYRPNLLGVVFLSLFTSNSFIGILFVSAFISQAGKLLGQELSDLLLVTFEEISRRVAFGLPPIAAGVAIALLIGWLVAFLFNLLQTHGLCTHRTADTLRITGGILVKKEYILQTRDISYVDIRQSLVTRLVGLHSAYVDAIGLGKDRSDIAAVVPFSTKRRTLERLALLLPEYQPSPRTLKPNAGAIMKFVLEPLWPCLLVPTGALVGRWLLPSWASIFEFAGFMLSLPAFWFLGVRLLDFASSGLSRQGDYYTLRYSELFYLHTVLISGDKLSLINIRQSILQRRGGKCDLLVSTRAEGRRRHHLRNLSRDACIAAFDAQDPPPSPAGQVPPPAS